MTAAVTGGRGATPRPLHIAINAWRDTSHPLAGGSEVMIDHLATGLAARGHRVELRAGGPTTTHPYTVRDGGGKFSQYLRAPVDHLRHQRHADLVVDIANGMSFYTPLWRREPTVCFVHHVHTEHWEQWFPKPVAAFGRTLERRAMPLAYASSLYATVSPSSAEALIDLGVAPERIRIVLNGVELPAPEDVAPEAPEPLFLAVGRLVPHKRYDLLARMWRQVHPVVGGRLVIIGEGPEAERIEALDVPGLELLGRVDEATRDRLYGEAWLLLHPSMLEGWGLVVMEAAAQATPTLAFDAPGVRDSVVASRTGVLAHTEGDYVDAWIELARNHDLRAKLGQGARERAEEFGWDATTTRFEEVAYEAVDAGRLARSRRRARPARPVPEARPGGEALPAAPGPDAEVRLPTSWELLRLFSREKTDPDPFYRALAQRSVAQFRHPFEGRRVLDLGCGHGYDTRAMRAAGAEVVPVDMDGAKLVVTGAPLEGSVQGDATRLPFPDASFDGVYCSNLLEHTPATPPVFTEIERVLKPGGWAWVSWTNWYSPWGGHEIVPLHMLGPDRGLRLWRRLFGEPRVNVPYVELWPTYVGTVLADVRSRPGLRLTSASPRYWPRHKWILGVPGLREVVTWNCVLELERTSGT
ncbi:glycosyltransferase [Iamia majanohamensis]|uniref:Glycosyltransferase n=1 Tax=Iamia majanohamensis TaxID=467976 RepID=A0AAF0BS02_9ACTN|nr:glycosyltransferase [Iamia majanohamensis]WCO67476.1 glycosyltransferase [Iamia majanohamensis]